MRILSYSENPDTVAITAAVLNDPPPAGKVYALPVPGPALTSPMYGGESAELFRRYLNELVNEWLRCGRRVIPAGATVHASGMRLSGGKTHWTPYLVPDRYSPIRAKRADKFDTSDPTIDSWLWKVYWDYLHRCQPTHWFNTNGEVFFWYMTPAYGTLDSPAVLPPFLNAKNGNDAAWLEAVLWFILFLNCGHVHRLDRCHFCGRFFVRARGKKSGQEYKRGGPSCGECKGADSKERTEALRRLARERMWSVAAVAWAGWKRSHRTPNRYVAVAARVNAECRKEILITTRKDKIEPLWVKRNEKNVVRLAEQSTAKNGGKRNAKS